MENPDRPSPNDPSLDPNEPIRRARVFWHICLFLPFVYIGIGLIVDRFVFIPNNGVGFWPMQQRSYDRLVYCLIVLVILAQGGVLVAHGIFARKILAHRLIPWKAARYYWLRTLVVAACADSVTLFGLIVFLLSAQWEPLLGCCIYAFIVYAQAYPRAHLLDEPGNGH